jgi:hypothetical protein
MHSLARSASVTATCILMGALLVGCGSAPSVPGLASGASYHGLGNLADLRTLKPSLQIGNEVLTGTNEMFTCTAHDTKVRVTGTATAPYPGTFVADARWAFNQNNHLVLGFSETFTITSGARTITGSFNWTRVSKLFGSCFLTPSKSFTYTATLVRGVKVRKMFAGNASVSGLKMGQFGETLI